MSKLILASASPQRKTLLEGLDFPFEVIPSSLNEADHEEKDPLQRAVILARLKAQDIASQHPQSFVIGCDTLVVSASGELYEKPKDAKDAEHMIRSYSGSYCTVHSALCVVAPEGKVFEDVSSNTVHFKKLSDAEIDWWISTNLWKDRSGSFQIDGKGQMMIKKIEGDWTSIVGLPVFLLGELLEKAGY